MPERKTYIVEHLDPELGPWSALEYAAIAAETQRANPNNTFMLSSLPPGFPVPEKLAENPVFKAETRGVEEIYGGEAARDRVCLLDPQAQSDLSPDDKREFDVFLFGGILGAFSIFQFLSFFVSFFLELGNIKAYFCYRVVC